MTSRTLKLLMFLGAVVGAVLALAPVASASSWVSTATRGLALKGTSLGATPASTPLRVAVALKIQNMAGLQQVINSGGRLTPAQFGAQFAPSSASVDAVESYLTSQGFTNVTATPNNLFVTATGTVAKANAAFNTQLVSYTVDGTKLYANSAPAQVPAALGGTVLSVLGLNNAAKLSGGVHADTVPTLTTYDPQGFWKAYDVGSTLGGFQTSTAIFGAGDMTQVIKDLRTEETAKGLPQPPATVYYTGPRSPAQAADEWDMDTQFSTGMALRVKHLYVYSATTLTDSDLALAFNKFATDNLAQAGSASFGECEYQSYLDGAMVAWDQIFAQAAAQGQTVFASSGDTGGFCPIVPEGNGVPAGIPDVSYPASSPYVVSVGGTTLLTNADGTYNNEAAWVAGGGGPSAFEYQPFWQNGVAPPTSTTCQTTVGCLGKTVPDVAMDADPNTGANVYVGGTPTGVGGTSLASPLALGVWARLMSSHSNTLGFAAPALYKQYGTPGFHDVTLGDVGPYPATPGYDLATGMGSFDVAQMNALIALRTPTPTLGSPACTVFSDGAGDAAPITSTDHGDSLDILAGGLSTSGSNLTAYILVKSLSAGPGGTVGISGDGDNWYLSWTYNGTRYFLGASLPGTSVDQSNPTAVPVDYSYGTVDTTPTGGSLYNQVGTATGTFDPTTNVITITAPLSVLGGPASGVSLAATGGQTFASVGVPGVGGLLESADTAGPGTSYAVGTTC